MPYNDIYYRNVPVRLAIRPASRGIGAPKRPFLPSVGMAPLCLLWLCPRLCQNTAVRSPKLHLVFFADNKKADVLPALRPKGFYQFLCTKNMDRSLQIICQKGKWNFAFCFLFSQQQKIGDVKSSFYKPNWTGFQYLCGFSGHWRHPDFCPELDW